MREQIKNSDRIVARGVSHRTGNARRTGRAAGRSQNDVDAHQRGDPGARGIAPGKYSGGGDNRDRRERGAKSRGLRIAMETSRLEIGCAAIKYLVPAGHPSPLRIRDRLDTVILGANCRRRSRESLIRGSPIAIRASGSFNNSTSNAAVNAGRRSGAHHPGIGDPDRQGA